MASQLAKLNGHGIFAKISFFGQREAKKVSTDPHYEVKNKTSRQTFQKSTIRRVLMRGFQIWSQKWNRKTFNPLFAQITVKILIILGKSGKSLDFHRFLAQKSVKSFPIWILRPNLESSHQNTSYRATFKCMAKRFIFGFIMGVTWDLFARRSRGIGSNGK